MDRRAERENLSNAAVSVIKDWSHIIIPTIGVGVGLSGFFSGFHLKHVHVSAWGLSSGIFAGIVLHLGILRKTGLLENWYSPKILCYIIKLGVIFTVAGLIGTITYVTITVVGHHGGQLSTAFYFTVAETILTFVWSLYLIILAWRLKVDMERRYRPLLGDVRPYPDDDE